MLPGLALEAHIQHAQDSTGSGATRARLPDGRLGGEAAGVTDTITDTFSEGAADVDVDVTTSEDSDAVADVEAHSGCPVCVPTGTHLHRGHVGRS